MKRAFVLLALVFSFTAAAQTPETNPALFERVLVPILVPATPGAFGSHFVTRLSLWNKSVDDTLEIHGLEPFCALVTCVFDPTDPLEVPPFSETMFAPEVAFNGTPGRFMYVHRDEVANLAAHLRVYDSSRSSTNFGTEVPVVRESDFSNRILLPEVPVDPRFRNTLRIYSWFEGVVRISFHGPEIIGSPTIGPPPPRTIVLPRRHTNIYEPAYAVFTDFPSYPYPLTVVVERVVGTPNDPFIPIWAFVSVTNNDTQHITTITPQ